MRNIERLLQRFPERNRKKLKGYSKLKDRAIIMLALKRLIKAHCQISQNSRCRDKKDHSNNLCECKISKL